MLIVFVHPACAIRSGVMHIEQLHWTSENGWRGAARGSNPDCQLVLYFGTRIALTDARFGELRSMFPAAHLLGCSTGGQISNGDIGDDNIAAVALTFSATRVRLARKTVAFTERSHEYGQSIGRMLASRDLAGIFVLSDGLKVNGSELVAGIASAVSPHVPITGGLAGDGAHFCKTVVGADCAPQSELVAAVGFYGNAIRVGHGSAGGWDQFGPRRRITRSAGNVLYELDGQPALDLYEKYLGAEDAKNLPGAALLFPLRITDPARRSVDLVRTVLAVDHEERSMTFAGDMPAGWIGQLMRGNFDRLAAGAADAARQARTQIDAAGSGDRVAILVSCIGRRLLMGQHVIDEIDAADGEIGPGVARLGFYSYGEISPHSASGICQLHNQTMTVTTLAEMAA
jgi:hypothetical protein